MRADKVCAKQPSPCSERSDSGPSGSDTLRRRRGTGSSRPVTTGLVAVLLAVAVLLLSPGRAPAVQAILSDDAYTAAGAPTTNFGASEDVHVGGSKKTFLKFDFSTLPAVTGADVEKATLTIFLSDVVAPGSFTVRLVTGPWDEGSLTASNIPSKVLTTIPAIPVGLGDAGSFLTIDITSLVKGWLDTPASNFGVALVRADTTLHFILNSKENTAQGHEARVDVSLVRGSGPAGPTGPTGATGPQGPSGPQGLQGVQGNAGAGGPTGATGPSGGSGPAGPSGAAGATGATGPAGAGGFMWNSTSGTSALQTGANCDYFGPFAIKDLNKACNAATEIAKVESNMPAATSVRIVVKLSSAPGGIATRTFTLTRNGSVLAGASCIITGASTTGDCTVPVSLADNDRVGMQSRQTGTPAGAKFKVFVVLTP